MKTRDFIGARRRQDPESGQAMVEFGLILFPLLLLVAGIIYFGIGLNYWLDEQRLANQGARWAVVNSYPGCPSTALNSLSCGTSTSLQRYIACQPVAKALKPTVTISFPGVVSPAVPKNGDPVQVTLTTPFKFVPIIGVGTINLKAKATMRLELTPVRYQAGSYTPSTCP